MEQHTQYRFNEYAFSYVEDHKELPINTPTRGKVYRGYSWNHSKEGYTHQVTAMYIGDGNWINPENPECIQDVEAMQWCDYIECVH